MQRNHLPGAEVYTQQNHRRRIWQKVVGGLACVVVFCTTYALILPAITQEREVFCGQEEHIHEESCYEQTSAKKELVCSYESLGVHSHSNNCYDADGNLICGLDSIAHTHNSDCYDADGTLVCTLAEIARHVHTEDCYVPAEAEEPVIHAHCADCYVRERGALICQEEEREGHSHGEACYASGDLICDAEAEDHVHDGTSVLVCELAEDPGHTHGDGCYEWTDVLVCGMAEGEAEPVPEKDPVLVCTEPVLDVHVHSGSCFVTTADDTLTCTLEEGEAHTHSAKCYGTWEAVCGQVEHTHTLNCYSDPEADVETAEDWEAAFADVELTGRWHEDVVLIAQSQLGYHESTANYEVREDGTVCGYTRYGQWYGRPYDDWCAMFASFCLHYAGVEGMPYDAGCQSWIEALSQEDCGLYHGAAEHEPQPGELIFFDGDGDGRSDHVGIVAEILEATDTEPAKIRTIQGNSSNCVQSVTYELDDAALLGYAELPEQMPAEDKARLEMVIGLIDEMPSADEIDAKMAAFEATEDYEGEEAWLTEVYQQVARAYYYYSALSDELKAKVTNADKLLELEYIWSVTTYEYKDSTPVYQINTYSQAKNTLLYGDAVSQVITSSRSFTSGWYAYVIKWNTNGYWYLSKYVASGTSKVGLDPEADGFILLLYGSSWGILDSASVSGTVYVTVNFDFTEESGYKAAGFGNVTFGTEKAESIIKKTSVESDEPTVVRSAKTSNFIDLNLYNYGSNINDLWSKNQYSYTDWNYNTKYTSKYPGFQWNGGAYRYSTDSTTYAKRTVIDNIDFGNSLITDISYSGSSHGKSTTATSVAFLADSGAYNINALDYYYDIFDFDDDGITNESQKYGINNRPIGYSIGSGIDSTNYDVMKRTLGSDGYPALADGTSLGYLFGKTSTYAKKQNTTSIDGLFQYEEKTGGYWYNSRWNHAQYSDNKFTLYNEIITPNLIAYPFGNFLPFNDITDSESATQVSKITSMGNYIQYFMNQLWSYFNAESWGTGVSVEENATKAQLYHMLNQYKQNISNSSIHGKTWSTFSANDAIWDYLTGSGANTGDNPTDSYPITDSYLEELYNIDYDVEKDFFFGMDMTMEFYMPKDGWVGKDNGDNSKPLDSDHNREGEPDGIPDQPMIFSFTGDDDVWVYLDDVLFLDLSGIHRHVGGRINYTEGKVYYYALDIETGDIDTANPYATYTFAQILKAAGKEPADYLKKVDGEYTTFTDYSTHTFKFYYMERGSGSSICSINFNFPLVEHNSITIEKELTDDSDSIEALGNPDFAFRVLKAGTTDELFLGKNWAYSLYDTDGSVIQEIVVSDSYQDGRVKEMSIKDADGNVLCTETYNSDGTRTSQTGDGLDKVLRIGDDGIFTLKAGQKAVFVGISQHAGEYYVQEVLHDDLKEQYGSITITGSASRVLDNIASGLVDLGDFVGADSPAQYASNSHVFHYENTINTDKLGALEISKTVDASYSGNYDKEYEFNVTLDGEPLPVGTSYGTDKTVETAGVIKLKHGETATISNIIAGTQFEVTETASSADGYTVVYKVGNEVQNGSSATGTIGLDTKVAVAVSNSEIGAKIEIPVWKNMAKNSGQERTFNFAIQQVSDILGNKEIGDAETLAITVGSLDQGGTFLRNYLPSDISGTSQNFYYKIYEIAGTDNRIRYDDTYYIVKVTVTKSAGTMSAEITEARMYTPSGTTGYTELDPDKFTITDLKDSPVVFTNVIVRNLTISKTVKGSDASKEASYKFTVTFAVGTSGTEIPRTVSGKLDGTAVTYEVTNGSFQVELKDGQTLELQNLAYGLAYTITEENPDGFKVTYTVNAGNKTTDHEGNIASGTIGGSHVTVAYTNTQLYALPQTGGAGTHMYTMAGLLLMLIGTAYLLYNKKRRREAI